MKEPFFYTEGAEIEMFIDGKWICGKVVNGYRFRDGLITMETAEGRRVWCGEASGAWREPVSTQTKYQEAGSGAAE